MAKRKMRVGECRTTKNGQKYCKYKKGVRFVKGGSRRSSNLSGGTKRKGKKGKHCVRYKRVTVKGTRGKQRRCAKFS